ncbi:MAG TPA: beta-lactamase induction protein [Oleiagrimonas sp.]|nr:beta-lactamase induction protein [Oleiagrimonas sp.]
MTFRLLALVIALLLVATVPLVRHCRDLRWFHWWTDRCDGTRGSGRVWLVLAPPAILAAIIGIIFSSADWLAVVWLAFAILVLIYTLGPRYLEDDIDAVLGAENREQAGRAAQALRVHADDDAALPLDPPALVEASVLSALKRRFGVVFWFLLLGPGGAVLYRLAQCLGERADTDAESRGAARRFAEGMDWPASHLMVFAMALVSDFDAVIGAWREWHRSPTRSPWTFESGFLGAVARAGVDADVAAGDEGENDISNPVIELTDTRRLLLRMLLVWLAVMAILVLLGWVA